MIIGPSQLKINILHKQTLWLQKSLDVAGITSAIERDIKSVLSLRLGAVTEIWAERVDEEPWEIDVSGGVELLREVVEAVD